tara:strand:- start:1309 stop:4341 length:3033 start_codon:yes stop_codon:yes gene_type:complete
MPISKKIKVKGARENNLKNISIDIPRDKFVVITGVSGSGKSSLAFNTIFAEGQRRYMESLSAYARQFLGRMEKPDVDSIEGLSPAISIDQKGVSKNPRSTVGTVTEIYDYLRLLFSRIGRPHCPSCGELVSKQSIEEISERILKLGENKRIMLLAPIIKHMKGEHKNIISKIRRDGYIRARVDGNIFEVEEEIRLNKNKWHNIEVVVDRLIIKKSMDASRLNESVEACLSLGEGRLIIASSSEEDIIVSENLSCANCDISIEELEPRNFSFNTPYGACKSCSGLGYKLQIEPELIIPNPEKKLIDGAIVPWTLKNGSLAWEYNFIKTLSEVHGFSLEEKVKDLSQDILKLLLYGSKKDVYPVKYSSKRGGERIWRTKFTGIVNILEKRFHSSESSAVRDSLQTFMTQKKCSECKGQRLKKDALSVKILNSNIFEISNLSVKDCYQWISRSQEKNSKESGLLSSSELKIGSQIFKEISSRLKFLDKVGLGYISLNRPTSTLSGGEGQRIRLASQIGSGLTGVMYVCDEPSIGLHPIDNDRLINTLIELKNLGNTVLVVEHDESIMRAADHIVDLGPGAGNLGGNVTAQGPIKNIINSNKSLTGEYLSGRKNIQIPKKRRPKQKGKELRIIGAEENNLKDLDISVPLQLLVCVTGASGSGKSTLVNEILYKSLYKHFHSSREMPGKHRGIMGTENLDKVINIDQSPIGRTPRSNPATYTGLFGPIRELFASVPESRAKGYKAGRFSFNVKGGRCENCEGAGYNEIQMQFLPDVSVPCEDCKGRRYNQEALKIKFKGLSISEILDLTVAEALKIFSPYPSISKKLETLNDVGLGYIKLGQPATTLSGGEAQRVKLSTYLSKRATGKTLFILDEPTTGLSFEDCNSLIKILHRLVDAGNSVVLIEHHLDVIKNADWIVDLGPGAGDSGGELIAEGSPENIAAVNNSFTGQYLNKESKIKPKTRTTKIKKISNKVPKITKDMSLFNFPKREQRGANNIVPAKKKFRRRRRSSSII